MCLEKIRKLKGSTWIKLAIETEKEAAASKMPPKTQNSGVDEKKKSCLVYLRLWEEGLISGPLKNSATIAPINDTIIPIIWTWIPEFLKFNSTFLKKNNQLSWSIKFMY